MQPEAGQQEPHVAAAVAAGVAEGSHGQAAQAGRGVAGQAKAQLQGGQQQQGAADDGECPST